MRLAEDLPFGDWGIGELGIGFWALGIDVAGWVQLLTWVRKARIGFAG